MRVISGKYRSRPLRSMRGLEIRPTSDRLRETLFDVLCAGNSDALAGLRFLDLFAGTGAVGIEAISRGATEAIFVESSPQAAALIRRNLVGLGISAGFRILQMDAKKALRQLLASNEVYDVIFLDPPYALRETYGDILKLLAEANSLIIVEHDRKFDPGERFGPLSRVRKLEQGDAALSFYRKTIAGS